jgi:ADP-glucose pyrophosphorylase
MVPFAGRYRIADFTLRNALACNAKKTLIFNNTQDDLLEYVTSHPLYRNNQQYTMKVISDIRLSVSQCARHLFAKPTAWYIIYNGDCPSVLDFGGIIGSLKKKKKAGPVLYMLDYDGKPTMSHVVLLCDRRSLESVFTKFIKEKKHSPEIFEMVINAFILKGTKREKLSSYYRPILSVPEYYHANFESLRDTGIYNLLFRDEYLKSGMNVTDYSFLGTYSEVSSSHLSEACKVYGTVRNSILFPGCVIEEKAVIDDSIVLPFNRIGSATRIERSVIDEFTDHARTDTPRSVSANSFIGNGVTGYKNADFPKSLFDSITLVGKNCSFPEGVRAGSACFIASGTGSSPFEKSKTLDDSLSIADSFNIHGNEPD